MAGPLMGGSEHPCTQRQQGWGPAKCKSCQAVLSSQEAEADFVGYTRMNGKKTASGMSIQLDVGGWQTHAALEHGVSNRGTASLVVRASQQRISIAQLEKKSKIHLKKRNDQLKKAQLALMDQVLGRFGLHGALAASCRAAFTRGFS